MGLRLRCQCEQQITITGRKRKCPFEYLCSPGLLTVVDEGKPVKIRQLGTMALGGCLLEQGHCLSLTPLSNQRKCQRLQNDRTARMPKSCITQQRFRLRLTRVFPIKLGQIHRRFERLRPEPQGFVIDTLGFLVTPLSGPQVSQTRSRFGTIQVSDITLL